MSSGRESEPLLSTGWVSRYRWCANSEISQWVDERWHSSSYFKLFSFISLLSRLCHIYRITCQPHLEPCHRENGQIKWQEVQVRREENGLATAIIKEPEILSRRPASHFQYLSRMRRGTSVAGPAICFSNIFGTKININRKTGLCFSVFSLINTTIPRWLAILSDVRLCVSMQPLDTAQTSHFLAQNLGLGKFQETK